MQSSNNGCERKTADNTQFTNEEKVTEILDPDEREKDDDGVGGDEREREERERE